MTSDHPTHRQVFALAVPIMLSNVSTPLLGVVDTAILGRVPDAALLAAVALGSVIFTFVFWAFGFLRMGTSGLVAQADGANDVALVRLTFARALLVALGLGVMLVVLRWPIHNLAFGLASGSERALRLASDYFSIRIWAAPATLCNYAVVGFLVGLGRTREVLLLQMILNGLNIVLDVWFVLGLGWGVSGVAAGTLVAEYLALAVAMVVLAQRFGMPSIRNRSRVWAEVSRASALRRLFGLNADIMLRTLSLIAVFVFFTIQGGKLGDATLAANSVLMQFVSVSAFFLDGLAFATERLVGNAVGQRDRAQLYRSMRRTTSCALGVASVLSLAIWLGGAQVVVRLTTAVDVRALAFEVLPWVIWAPLAGVGCFQLDGIFIGMTRTREMRSAMLVSLGVFLAAWWMLRGYGNHGLWGALFVHYAARTVSLGAYAQRIVRVGPW